MPVTNVELSVGGLDLGHPYLASKIPLEGITYDPMSDMLTFFFFFETLAHDVDAPREVRVDERSDGLHSLWVVDSDVINRLSCFTIC
jgi:hypothetical protein